MWRIINNVDNCNTVFPMLSNMFVIAKSSSLSLAKIERFGSYVVRDWFWILYLLYTSESDEQTALADSLLVNGTRACMTSILKCYCGFW